MKFKRFWALIVILAIVIFGVLYFYNQKTSKNTFGSSYYDTINRDLIGSGSSYTTLPTSYNGGAGSTSTPLSVQGLSGARLFIGFRSTTSTGTMALLMQGTFSSDYASSTTWNDVGWFGVNLNPASVTSTSITATSTHTTLAYPYVFQNPGNESEASTTFEIDFEGLEYVRFASKSVDTLGDGGDNGGSIWVRFIGIENLK